MTINQEFLNRISWWHLRAKREKDHWIRFILYYFMFDAYLSEGSKSGNDQVKLKWFLNTPNPLKNKLKDLSKKLLDSARALKDMSPVRDMRPGSSKISAIKNENDLGEVVRFIYQIRCNLFHGSKDRMDGRDSNLVYYAGEFLRDAINWWLA